MDTDETLLLLGGVAVGGYLLMQGGSSGLGGLLGGGSSSSASSRPSAAAMSAAMPATSAHGGWTATQNAAALKNPNQQVTVGSIQAGLKHGRLTKQQAQTKINQING